MRLMDRLYDNDWYVASARPDVQADVAAELLRAAQAHDVAIAEVERARAVSPGAVVLALSSSNATQAALGRAQARATGRRDVRARERSRDRHHRSDV